MSGILWFYLAIYVLWVLGMWCVFAKAGEDGWKAIIPIWNTIVLLRIVGRPVWWIILFIIPIVSFIVWIIVANDLSKSFARGVGTTIGLILLAPIFTMILGFGSAEYQGPAARQQVAAPAV
jgi:hypothetical protein